MPQFFTVPEYAKLKNTTVQTIYNAIKRDELDFIKLYNKMLIKKNKINAKWQPVEYQKRFKKTTKSTHKK